jgi:hypothetical protein
MTEPHLLRVAGPVLLALLTSALPPSSRPVQAPDLAEETADDDPRSSGEKRILHLRSARFVRAFCRWTEAGWEIRRDGAWILLEAGSVISWRSEAELSRERARRSREIRPHDNDSRAALSKWMLGEGLVEEALEEIDRVLGEEPDHAGALELIASAPFPRPNGGDPRTEPKLFAGRLFGAGVAAGPARRELIILSLGALQEIEGGSEILHRSLARELGSYRVLRRTFAAHALRRLLPGKEIRELLRRCALDTSRPVREAASLALHDTGEAGIVVPLVKALRSDSRAVRTNAAESLGNIGYPAAVPALVAHFATLPVTAGSGGTRPPAAHIYVGTEFAYVGDFDVEIAQGASIADPIVMSVQDAVVLDARVGGVSGYTKVTEFKVVRTALEKLTGSQPGRSQRDWERWYEANRERFEKGAATGRTRTRGD